VIRYLDALGMCRQRLIELKLYDASFTGAALAAATIQALNNFALPFQGLEAIICDGASVNRVACQEIRAYAPDLTHVPCISHGLDNVGRNMVSQRGFGEPVHVLIVSS
jgi:hypothetical protein